MKLPIFLIPACIFCCNGSMLQAQQVLGLEETIAIGLSNNYDVLLVKNESKILENSVTYGNAGMLPSVQLAASVSQSTSNINQKFSTGLELRRNGVGSGNFSSGVALNWTLFDGFKMFVTYKKLQEIAAQGELQVRQQMENTVFDIISAYYNIARQEQKRKTIVAIQNIYRERVSIAQARLDLGNGSMADLVQAKLELNEQLSAEVQQNTLITNGKSALNAILGAKENYDFRVDSLETTPMESWEEHRKQLESGNILLQIATSQITQAGYFFKENQSYFYPKVGLGLNYNLSRTNSEAGFALFNQNLGFTYGLNLTWNIFNGMQLKNATANARMMQYSAELNYYREKKRAEEEQQQAWQRFAEAHKLIDIEKESVSLGQQYVNIVMERFKLAQSTSLELKDAQNSYLNAQIRLIEAQYNAKVAQAELKRLEGNLF